MDNIKEKLFRLQDVCYGDFHSKLMPNIAREKIIGIRVPVLRRFVKDLSEAEKEDFLQQLPHNYYEENNLHGLIIMESKDYGRCIGELERFLPYIDNWATCDMLRPKILSKHLPELLEKIYQWLASEDTYIVRLAIGFLMSFYLDDGAYQREYLAKVAEVSSKEYYVRMMVAWYFATALAKQYQDALPYMQKGRMEEWTRRKAIQKALESRRVSPEHKEYLRSLR
ncbi:MAG: DNA alkylation repair protein [Veillonellaceae bacterium]|nr:DNA alkylation repair protein [Veillonellaceae bacterium]